MGGQAICKRQFCVGFQALVPWRPFHQFHGQPAIRIGLAKNEIADAVWDLVAAMNNPKPELYMTGDGARRLEENQRGGQADDPDN